MTIPCTKVEGETVKDWFQKINEELDEFKAEVLNYSIYEDRDGKIVTNLDYLLDKVVCNIRKRSRREIAEEAADAITAITSMLEAMGIDEDMRQAAQKRVNEKNKERGRF